MYATAEQLASANRANIETLLSFANTAFASAERLAALNLNTARGLLEESVANAKAILDAKDAQEFLGLQSALAKPAADKVVAYSRSVYEIASQTQEELGKIAENRYATINQNVDAALDKLAKNGPAGSDLAVAAVKSAIAAANTAFDNVSKAARQMAGIAEANVAAAANAAVKATGTKAKKAA